MSVVDLTALAQLPARVAALEADNAKLRGELAAVLVQFQAAQPSADELLTVEQAAQLRGCTVAAMHKAIQRKRIPCVRNGRSIRVRRGDVS